MLTPNGGVFGRNPKFNNVQVDGNLTVNGDIALGDDIVVADSLTVQGTTASTSTTTGALRVTGGVGIGGALYTGADAFINGARVGIGPAGTDNTVLGVNAGAALQASADNNVLIGRNAGLLLSTQDNNIAIGRGALDATSTGSLQCVAIGTDALGAATSTGNTVAIGNNAASGLTGGSSNVIIGADTAHTGSHSSVTAVGYAANGVGGTGTNHVCAFGNGALLRNRANDVVAVGSEALDANTLGTANVALGRSALGAATTAIGTFTTTPVAAGSGYTANQTGVTVTLVKKSGADTFTGTVQAALTTNASGAVTAVAATPVSAGATFTGTNVIFEPSGFGAGSGCEISIATLATAESNTAVGHQAGLSLTIGTRCTFVGSVCGDAVTSGIDNTGVGADSLGATTSGFSNVGVGTYALASNITGTSNTAIGWGSGINIGASAATATTQFTAIGASAGRFRGSGTDTLTRASDSVFIGANSRANGDSQTNQVVIAGVNGLGDGSNTTVIGNTSTTSTRIPAGNLTLTNGNLIMGTAGTGIDFSATGNTSFNATAAAGWVQRTATNVANNDTVTIGTTVYTFKTTLTPADYEVLIGADASASLTNLRHAILGTGGTPGTDYQVPAAHPTVTADAINGLRLPLRAITAGTAGNSIALAETSAQLTVNAATLTGGVNAGGTTAELLSDYEEGTWLPTFSFSGSNGDMLLTYSVRVGRYIKIGRSVTVWGNISGSITHSTASAQPRITNLPFTSGHEAGSAISVGAAAGFTLSTNYSSLGGIVLENTTQVRIDQFGAAVASTFMNPTNVTTNGTLAFNFTATYQTT